jgi:hypothetical protein
MLLRTASACIAVSPLKQTSSYTSSVKFSFTLVYFKLKPVTIFATTYSLFTLFLVKYPLPTFCTCLLRHLLSACSLLSHALLLVNAASSSACSTNTLLQTDAKEPVSTIIDVS